MSTLKKKIVGKMANGDIDWKKNAAWAAMSRAEKAYKAKNKTSKAADKIKKENNLFENAEQHIRKLKRNFEI